MNLIYMLLLGSSLLILSAVFLWFFAEKKARMQSLNKHLQLKITERQVNPVFKNTLVYNEKPFLNFGPSAWNNLLLRASIAPTALFYLVIGTISFGFAILIGLFFSLSLAIFYFIFSVALLYLLILIKAARLKNRISQQLPVFLESMVRLLSVGNSLGSAFQNSLISMDPPLKPLLEKASALLYSGQSLDNALNTVANQYRLRELHLIAAVITIALQFGGRSDVVLERMAVFMRDLEQARMELHALSAEVRLSAWILSLLPLILAGAIMTINRSLLVNMWADPAGKIMLYIAIFLQTAGSLWLYKMAKSV